MTNQGSTPAGWYPAPGDPPGTHRYWDGSQWTTGPQPIGGAPQATAQPTAAGAAQSFPTAQQQGQFQAAGAYGYQQGGDLVHGRTLADPGKRIVARLIDAAIILAGYIVVLIFAAIADALGLLALIAWIAFAIGYELYFTAIKGATIGKKVMGLTIITQDTGMTPLGWGPAALRWIAGIIPCSGLISLVLLFTDKRHETVNDKIGKTWVVNA